MTLFDPALDRVDVQASASSQGDQAKTLVFSGGIDRSVPPNAIAENCARFMSNVYYPREVLVPRTRPGLRRLTTSAPAGRVTAITVYQPSPGTNRIVCSVEDDNASPADLDLYYLKANIADPTVFDPTLLHTTLGTQALSALGITPSFKTFNGKLLVAVAGQPLREWNGQLGATPARSTGKIHFSDQVAAGTWITVGNRTFTFYASRTQPGEVAVGASKEASAENLAAAINSDSWDVKAVCVSNDVNLTARHTGAAGDSTALADGPGTITAIDLTAFHAGADGAQLDVIDTYQAGTPGIVTGDKNRRIVCGGDPNQPDRMFFSAPGNAWSFATGLYGFGEYWDVGAGEGNVISALVSFADELWCHKTGQNREIHRARIADPNPETWDMQMRPFSDVNAAIAHRAAITVGDKHLVLDRDFVGVYQGVDTYDEIRAGLDGNKVYDLIRGTSAASAFMVINPAELYTLIFPRAGKNCLVFHNGSRRWTAWQFSGPDILCGVYSEALGTMLFGCADGHVYAMDESLATDNGAAFQSQIIGKSLGGETLGQLVVKQVMVDYQHVLPGSGTLDVVVNRDESGGQWLMDFVIGSGALLFAAATATDGAQWLMEFQLNTYAREGENNQATGEMLAPRITWTGAAHLNCLAMRVSTYGRAIR